MGNYVIYRDFTAHAAVVQGLGALYRRLDAGQLMQEEVMPLIVFTAFSIEAYVNNLGCAAPDWNERAGWRAKIEKLHSMAGQACNWNAPPLDFASEVFSIRNRLAHGKPERVELAFSAPADQAADYLSHADLSPRWFAPCLDLEWARTAKARFLPLTSYLGALFGQIPAHIAHASATQFDMTRSDPDAPTTSIFEMNLPRSILY